MKRNTLPRLLFNAGLTILVFFYFSRYFHDSYFGIALTLLALAYCASGREEKISIADG